jgi:ATP-binding cassette subfamily B protein
MRVVSAGMLFLSFLYFGFAAIRGDLDVGDLSLLVTATLALTPQVVPEDIALAYGAAVLPRIKECERLAERLGDDRVGDAPAPRAPATIRFEAVTFRYPHASEDTLHHLDLELRAGERTALVGVNGAGKTTIVKLLCGLYEPTAGRITIDGEDLEAISADQWRERLAVLFQDFVRYELTARENVAVGRAASDDDLSRVAARVGADRVVFRLSAGWDTPLSPHFSGGTDLSGGEWQRLAFSRALFAVDRGARVLVLDEPTANLDVRAEAELYEQLIDLTESPDEGGALITVLVSHRLSTIRRADRIVVIDNGAVSEDGTHDELMMLGSRYAAMFRAQASRFAEDAA